MVYAKRYKTLLLIDFALKILKKHEEDEDPLPNCLHCIQNINDKMKEGCGIIASKQPPKSGFIRLEIKKSLIGRETTEVSLPIHESITFFSHKQKSKSELTQLYNTIWVYNHKRHGEFKLNGKKFLFKLKSGFLETLTTEFLVVDLLDSLNELAEDSDKVIESFKKNISRFDVNELVKMSMNYGSGTTITCFD